MLLNLEEVLPDALLQSIIKNVDNNQERKHPTLFSLDPRSINSDVAFIIKPVTRDKFKCDFSSQTRQNSALVVDCKEVKVDRVNVNQDRMTSAKSQVPDILLINKYYGLIPQKFTISSRNASKSSSNVASSYSRRTSANITVTSKPRAKSSTHINPHNRHGKHDHGGTRKGSMSDSESQDSSNMLLSAQHGSVGSGCETSFAQLSDPFGPVTKKMAVERYKKWRCNGGKGRNPMVRSSSEIGKSLSLLDNGLPGGFPSHARQNNNRASTAGEFPTNRRVIRIDLNKVSSWDDENYGITTTSCIGDDSGENKEKLKTLQTPPCTPTITPMRESDSVSKQSFTNSNVSCLSNNNSYDYTNSSSGYCGSTSSQSRDDSCLESGENCATMFTNNTNKHHALATFNESKKNEHSHSVKNSSNTADAYYEKESHPLTNLQDNTLDSLSNGLNMSTSIEKNTEPKAEPLSKDTGSNEEEENNNVLTTVQNSTSLLESEVGKHDITPVSLGNDKKLASMQRNGKLSSKTLSFDENTLESGTREGSVTARAPDADSSRKKRPLTAAGRVTSSKSFSTPNSFNPPSRVIPWTQQKSTGGKTLTLAERRAKFQRVSSIHSSSSLSMETGEEEILSEVESTNSQSNPPVRPPSSAFREFRKPLHVTQPPEISTMISQINPTADDDIQIEIEKVALMLKKMSSATQFSVSLDSGIEAEMPRNYSSMETISCSVSNAACPSGNNPDSLARLTKVANYTNDATISSSSSSECDTSDEEESQSKEKKKSIPRDLPGAKGKSATSVTDPTRKSHKKNEKSLPLATPRQKTVLSQNNINIQSNNGNSEDTLVPSTKRNPSLSTTRTRTSSVSTLTGSSESKGYCVGGNRPTLRKAVSISCEKELLKTDGDHKRNEVNLNTNGNDKSGRPKTANVTSSHNQRINVSGTRSINNNNYSRRQNTLSSSAGESHQTNFTSSGGGGGSQGSRNRKILIKKALMEVSQSSVNNARNKLGSLARPRTAPSNNNAITQNHHPRKPLKASPFPITSAGRNGILSSGNSVSRGGGKTTDDTLANKVMEKGCPNSHVQRASSEGPLEEANDGSTVPSQEQSEQPGESSKSKGKVFRQCLSLDETALLGFSIRSVNGGRIPIFDKLAGSESTESCPNSIMDDDVSFLSSKKREQCLKVYEKMVRTGCTIKLETVFRGMLTPSEYRAFIRAAEKQASLDAEEEKPEDDLEEDNDSNSNEAVLE